MNVVATPNTLVRRVIVECHVRRFWFGLPPSKNCPNPGVDLQGLKMGFRELLKDRDKTLDQPVVSFYNEVASLVLQWFVGRKCFPHG